MRRFLRRLFRHRHRYRIARPGVTRDGLTGHLFGATRFYCSCGQEEPTGAALYKAVEGRGRVRPS